MPEDKEPSHLDYAGTVPGERRAAISPRTNQFLAFFCSVIAALIGFPAIWFSIGSFQRAWRGPGADFWYGLQWGFCFLIPGLACIFIAGRWFLHGMRGK